MLKNKIFDITFRNFIKLLCGSLRCMLFLLACMVVKYGVLDFCRQAGNSLARCLRFVLHFLKSTLGVKQSTTNWAVLRECGHEPLQFYWFRSAVKPFNSMLNKSYKGYKDGLQPESLADGNWLVKQKQPVSKIETKSDTNLRSLYKS